MSPRRLPALASLLAPLAVVCLAACAQPPGSTEADGPGADGAAGSDTPPAGASGGAGTAATATDAGGR